MQEDVTVSVEVLNINGSKVTILVNENMNAGDHLVQWDGTDDKGNKLVRGMYLFKLKTNSVVVTIKVIIH